MSCVLIPWQAGCKHRAAALDWVTTQYAENFPDWEIVVCELAADEPWNKAKALQAGIEATKRHELVVMNDADCWCDGLTDAIAALDQDEWAVPHKGVFRLDENATQRVLEGDSKPSDESRSVEQRAYPGTVGGGIVAMHSETFRRVPIDPRFQGWGQEDDAWALALYMLAGHPWRGKAPLYHLWHPPQERLNRRIGSVESKALLRRYGRARTREDMQTLIDEVAT